MTFRAICHLIPDHLICLIYSPALPMFTVLQPLLLSGNLSIMLSLLPPQELYLHFFQPGIFFLQVFICAFYVQLNYILCEQVAILNLNLFTVIKGKKSRSESSLYLNSTQSSNGVTASSLYSEDTPTHTLSLSHLSSCILITFMYGCVCVIILPYPLVGVIPIPAVAAAKSLQSCPTLYDPIDGSPPGSPVPGILQASTTWQIFPKQYPFQRREKMVKFSVPLLLRMLLVFNSWGGRINTKFAQSKKVLVKQTIDVQKSPQIGAVSTAQTDTQMEYMIKQ